MDQPQGERVKGAKSVDTAALAALKPKYSAGKYWDSSPSCCGSTARSLARSSVSSSTRCRSQPVQDLPGTGGTASSIDCGAHTSGGLNWKVRAVASFWLGTTSTHSSMSKPNMTC